jgi:16S rRNA (guanine1207-N2)-methyltransferase
MIANVLQPDAHLLLVGSGNAGIRSSRTLLEEQIGPAVQRDAARHCVFFQAALRKTPSPFNLDEWVQTFHFPFHAHTMTAVSLPGVFSHGELDPGSALLLQTLDTPPTGRTLDFGCGAGILGAAIRKVWPHTIVDMVDVNALALEATRRTLLANGLPAQNIHPSDVFSGVTGRYALILSNPPFHTGVEIDYRATTALFEEARNHLEPGGKVRIVANRFLKYAPILESTLGSYKIIAEDNRYRVYEVA